MRTIHINDEDCFIVIKYDGSVQLNVPMGDMGAEIPENAKLTVALTHLINDNNKILNKLMQFKWDELVDFYKESKRIM